MPRFAAAFLSIASAPACPSATSSPSRAISPATIPTTAPMTSRLPRRATGRGRSDRSAAAEAPAAQAQQQHAELAPLRAEVAEAREDGDLAVVDDPRSAGGHARGADQPRHLAAPFHQPQDLGV